MRLLATKQWWIGTEKTHRDVEDEVVGAGVGVSVCVRLGVYSMRM